MIELSPGRKVFLYRNLLDKADAKKTATHRACYLMSCFWTPEELKGSNLTGKNDKKKLNQDIIENIIGK